MDTLPYFQKLIHHYSRFDVQIEIAKQCQHKEFALIKRAWTGKEVVIRWLTLHNHKDLQYHIKDKKMETEQIPFSFYHSIATLKPEEDVPKTYIPEKEKEQWKDTYYEHIQGFDLFIDIDAPKDETTGKVFIDLAYESTKTIKTLFDKHQFPYSLRFSGRGFHFITPHHYFAQLQKHFNPHNDINSNIYTLYRNIAKYLYDQHSELIDLQMYESKRLCKIPYSIACYQDQAFICYPFASDQEFNSFQIQEYNLMQFNKPIAYRGIHIFNKQGNIHSFLNEVNQP